MVEREAVRAARRDRTGERRGEPSRMKDRSRGLGAGLILVALVLGAWCLPTRAGSGTTGVLGVSNINQGQGGGEQQQPPRRGFAVHGPARQAP